MLFALAATIPAAAAVFWLIKNSRVATATPEYKLIRKDGDFEIRDYPDLTLADTPMESGDKDGS